MNTYLLVNIVTMRSLPSLQSSQSLLVHGLHLILLCLIWTILTTSESIHGLDTSTVTCAENQFQCTQSFCIPLTWHCDGQMDCPDGSDEDSTICEARVEEKCRKDEFQCFNGNCIPNVFLCDGAGDCPNGEDENTSLCTARVEKKCRKDEFQCSNGNCIPNVFLCDGDGDCPNGEDENKSLCTASPEHTCDSKSQFKCGNGLCIPVDKVCNKETDCPGNEDELKCKCTSNDNGCSQKCVETPDGHHCECFDGYKLVGNHSCVDVDECEYPGVCSQICINEEGSFKCSCISGYDADPQNSTHCRATTGHGSLIYIQRNLIGKVSLASIFETSYIINHSYPVALDFSFKAGKLFWSSIGPERNIYSTPIDQKSNETVVMNNVTCEGIAVDWIYNHIYWTNPDDKIIEVADLEGSMRIVLIKNDLKKPRGIGVDPFTGWMFYTDWGREPKIERSGMDGANRQKIISENLGLPNGLTLDFVLHRVYWVDAKEDGISACNYDGSNRQVIVGPSLWTKHPFSVTTFEDWIYWGDWSTHKIYRANKFSGRDVSPIVSSNTLIHGIQVYHPYRQLDGVNYCETLIGNCSHLCLPAAQLNSSSPKTSCVCPTGFELKPDRMTCIDINECDISGTCSQICLNGEGTYNCSCISGYKQDPNNHNHCISSIGHGSILYAHSKSIEKISLETNQVEVIPSLNGTENALCLDYSYQMGMVFWFNNDENIMYSVKLDEENSKRVMIKNLTCEGLAVDWIFNHIYWTDATKLTIEVADFLGNKRKVLIDHQLDKPRAIVVNPLDGWMFWTDWGEEPKIERGCMDGSCREKIVTDRLKWINSLTIDFVLQRLYWVDAWEGELSSCKYDGSDRQIIIEFSNFLKRPFTMTTFEDWVYWIDWSLKSVNKADKFSGQSGSTIVANKTKMTGIQLFHPYRQPDGVNHCQSGNYTCSYLCLPTAYINSSTPKVSCVVPDEISTVSDDQSVCSGTNKRMSVPENHQQHYKFLQENYSSCTYVQGNLEITWLQDENMDLSFLQHIREVTGYVLISHVNIYRVVLPKLQIIRGQTRFKLSVRDEEFALFISLSKMHSLELPELRDILKGSVGDVNNYNLCHSETILWDEIINGDDGKFVQIYNFSTPKRECVPCDDSCDKGCWNIGPENCQKFSKLNCNSQCSKLRCYGEHEAECCHHLCAGGCYGPRLHDCLACRYFSNNGECTETCPPLQRYNPITYSWESNPNGKYLYGSSCVTKCPDNYLSDNGTCVQNCPSGKKVMNGECVPCNGPCKRTCQGVFVHSGNIDQFQDCTTIEGSISILDATFAGFQQVYPNFTFGPRYEHMHPSKLEVFSSVNKITGYIHVEAKHPDFRDLSYFRNLKFIEGQELTDFSASLYIVKSSLKTLGLSSLEKIGSNCVIMENRDLCFVSEINWNNLVSSNVKLMMIQNKDTNICIAEDMVCDMECSEDGCWGPGPKQCLTCARSKLGNHCLHNCSMIPRTYNVSPNTCEYCHTECESGCHGPGPGDCTRCKNVHDDFLCLPECPIGKYADESGECKPCHSLCMNGCSGPLNTEKPGICNLATNQP